MAIAPEASGSADVDETARLMKELGLREEDLDDVVFEEDKAPPATNRWMALARVHMDKPYSQFWFFKNMRAAWDLAQDVKFRPLEDNLYTLQFSCLGDWERVMQEGPWHLSGNAVIIVPYDGVTKPSTIQLNTIDIWIQIHDVPDLYAHLDTPLASKVGEVLFTETQSHDFTENFFRVRVRINVQKPLKNAVSMIRDLKRQIYKIKYERLPDWCAVCGHLGHVYKEHGDGIPQPSAPIFKDLRASWYMGPGRGPGGGRGRGRAANGGRGNAGRGPGRGSTGAEKLPGEKEQLDGLDLDAIMSDADSNKKRAADLATLQAGASPVLPSPMTKNELALLPPVVPPSPSSKQDPKKARTTTSDRNSGKKGSTFDKNYDATSATSSVEDHRAQ